MRSGKKTTRKISFSGCVYISSKRVSISSQPSEEPVADPERVGLDGEGGVATARGGHEAAVGDVEVVEVPDPAVLVQRRVVGVGAEPGPPPGRVWRFDPPSTRPRPGW